MDVLDSNMFLILMTESTQMIGITFSHGNFINDMLSPCSDNFYRYTVEFLRKKELN